MPIAPVSPSPLMPIAIILRLATTAPVPTDGIRPWTELKPCALFRKYAGALLEQPMPDSLMTWVGSMPRSKNESMMRSVIALCPHPAHSVVFEPRYASDSRPMRLTFLPGADGCTGASVDMSVCFSPSSGGLKAPGYNSGSLQDSGDQFNKR